MELQALVINCIDDYHKQNERGNQSFAAKVKNRVDGRKRTNYSSDDADTAKPAERLLLVPLPLATEVICRGQLTFAGWTHKLATRCISDCDPSVSVSYLQNVELVGVHEIIEFIWDVRIFSDSKDRVGSPSARTLFQSLKAQCEALGKKLQYVKIDSAKEMPD